MEELIDLLLDELYFPAQAQDAAAKAGIAWPKAQEALQHMVADGLIRREDFGDDALQADTVLVCTKKGLLRANGLS